MIMWIYLCIDVEPSIVAWYIGNESIYNETFNNNKSNEGMFSFALKLNVTSAMCGETVSYRINGIDGIKQKMWVKLSF